ncbi:Os03g0432354 [Oryza sativa Japonica Group]|uniref:Os03g0432354 protein n=1 Tax=Oryza sativa subsp. japonica TaxID=39947 RepID=A0A0P0VZ15_ORYSJ|nr:Os03g0432354 [Oryza sativa Japonica Group]
MGAPGEGSTTSRRMGRPSMLHRRFACLRNAPRNPPQNARLSSRRIDSGVRSFGGTVPSCPVCLRSPSSSL